MQPGRSYCLIAALMTLRYFLLAGFAFAVFYVWLKRKFLRYRIQTKFPRRRDYYREMRYSLSTICIFSGYAFLVFQTSLLEHTLVYRDIGRYGVGYLIISVFICILLHDTWFYFTHRLMHKPFLYRWVHRVHHRSVNPSPWAAYSFHPLEALIEGAVLLLIVFLIPVHPLALVVFLLFMLVFNIYGHLGYELYPRRWRNGSVGKWLNSATAHNEHHHYFYGNYGLYFSFWDRLMGTARNQEKDAYPPH